MTVYINGVPVAVAPGAHESTHVSGGSDDIDSALVDAAIPSLAASKITSGRFPMTRMPDGTAAYVLTGQGVGVSPAYAAAGATLTVAETEVFNATSPTAWTDLDLSGIVGSNVALVMLKIYSAAGPGYCAVRTNGDTDEFFATIAIPRAVALGNINGSVHNVFFVTTDSSGVIEWRVQYAQTTTVDVMAYIK